MPTKRTIEVLREGQWVAVGLKELIPGDIFRMLEPNGSIVIDDKSGLFLNRVDGYPYEYKFDTNSSTLAIMATPIEDSNIKVRAPTAQRLH